MWRAGRVLALGIVLAGVLVPAAPVQAAAPCTLCIVELQAMGAAGVDVEAQDVLIITNRSTANITSVQLRYIAASGVPSEASSLNIGTVNAGATRVFVAPSLTALNPSAESLKTLQLASAGGALVVGRSTSSTVYDSFGWGTAKAGYEGAPAPAMPAASSMVRRMASGQLLDTDQNAADFMARAGTCSGVEFNEIQPFVTDETGGTVDAWAELYGAGDPTGDCMLVSLAGEAYRIGVDGLPTRDNLSVVSGVVTDQGAVLPLHLGEASGQLWLADVSQSSGAMIYTPVTSITYSNLARGQSYAQIDGLWRRTYDPTPGAANAYMAAAPVPEVTSTACETVVINEIIPNPLGEDTGKEWVELHNIGTDMAPIGACQVVINGAAHGFLDDEVLAAGEYRAFSTFYDADAEPSSLSLRNTEDNLIGWQRNIPAGSPATLQQLLYADAPEGSSWSRYDVGWRWDDTPTPGADNATLPDAIPQVPIEQPAPTSGDTSGGAVADADPQDTQPSNIPVIITELLPNPAAPQTDDADEFIELYNNSDQPIALRGYKLQVGNTYGYSYTLADEVVPAHGYLAVMSSTSNIGMSNTSGRARLVTGTGEVVSETGAYGSAAAGASWAWINGGWQWTSSPTPALANVLTLAAAKAMVKTGTAKSSKSSTAKSAKSTKTSTAKATTNPKAAKDKQPSATASKKVSLPGGGQITAPPLHIAVLAGVGALAVLYAAYEYRHDIANRIHQLRRNRGDRRLYRQTA